MSGSIDTTEATRLISHQSSSTQRLLLYFEVFVSSFSERLWGFAVPLLLASMYPKNMWPAASVALVETLGGFLAGPFIGIKIDTSNKLAVMRVALVGQNVSILLASGCFYLMVWLGLSSDTSVPYEDWRFWLLIVGILIVTAINSGAVLARTVSMQKIWVPAICEGDAPLLIATNAAVRRINLVCEIGAPLAFGLLVSFLPINLSLSVPIFVVIGWTAISFLPEMIVLQALFKRIPSLSDPSTQSSKAKSWIDALKGVAAYGRHDVLLASLAYALLFVTVLMPGVLMTSFLLFSNVKQWEIAVFRGLCAITGIIATIIASPIMRNFGTVRAGSLFSWFQWSFLVPAVAAAFLPMFGYTWAVYIFMAMVIVSRMGLWGFDLAEVNIMQVCVDQTESGVINSVEYGATQLGSLLPYIAGIFVNDPLYFPWLVVGSCCSVLFAAILYSIWTVKKAHLFPKLSVPHEVHTVAEEQDIQ